MGREVRMVPPNWQHPRDAMGHLQPMFDRDFAEAATEWKAEFAKWESGERPDYCDDEKSHGLEFWEWDGGPPDRKYHRTWKPDNATWFQVWETVTEGTPVTPAFATREELAAHLAEHGDDWDQTRGHGGWGIERASAFVNSGWAPSAVITGGRVLESKDVALELLHTATATNGGTDPQS